MRTHSFYSKLQHQRKPQQIHFSLTVNSEKMGPNVETGKIFVCFYFVVKSHKPLKIKYVKFTTSLYKGLTHYASNTVLQNTIAFYQEFFISPLIQIQGKTTQYHKNERQEINLLLNFKSRNINKLVCLKGIICNKNKTYAGQEFLKNN